MSVFIFALMASVAGITSSRAAEAQGIENRFHADNAQVVINAPKDGDAVSRSENLAVEVAYDAGAKAVRLGTRTMEVPGIITAVALFVNGEAAEVQKVADHHEGTIMFALSADEYPEGLSMDLQARAYDRYESPWFSRLFPRMRLLKGNVAAESSVVRVVFSSGEPPVPTSGNLLVNGGFESGSLSPWIFQNWFRRGTATITSQEDEFAEGAKGVRVDITRPGAYWMVHLRQQFSFTPQRYTLTFRAKASTPRSIIVNAQEEGSWINLGMWKEQALTTDWTRYSFSFTPQISTHRGQVVFNMGESDTTVWLDDVTLTTVGTPPPPPPPPPPPSTTGILSVSANATTPVAGLLPANTEGVTVGVLGLSAQNEDVHLEKLSVRVNPVNGGGPDQFDKIWLTDGIKSFGVTPTSSDTQAPLQIIFDMTSDPFFIPANGFILLTLKVDTANIDRNDNSKAYSGEGFQLTVNSPDDVTATGVQSGLRPTVAGTPNFFQFTFYRSVPTIAFSNPVTNVLSGNGVYDLFKFSVAANQKGPIGLYKFTFGITTTTVSVTNFEVWDSHYTSGPIATRLTETGEANPSILEFLFDINSDGTGSGGEFREVPAVGTRTYTLRGAVTGYDPSTPTFNGVTTMLAGDASFPSSVMQTAASADAGDQDDFIWSDFSYTTMYNTSTATNTVEWTNGYRVQGFPSTTSTAQAI